MTPAALRARALYPSSDGFQAAYVGGANAALAGRPVDACPYRGRRGWLRAWRAAWLRGFHSVPRED